MIDEVAEAERDGFIRLFGRSPAAAEPAARRWVQRFIRKGRRMDQNFEDMPGYDEMLRFLAEEVPRERVLRLYKPEERLADLSPDQQVLALSDEVLRGFPDSYLCTLSPEVQERIRKRIRRPLPQG